MSTSCPRHRSPILTSLGDRVSSVTPPSPPCGHRRLIAEPLDEPLGVVPGYELADEPVRLGEVLEAMEIQALLLEGAHEALDDAIAFRLVREPPLCR